jgi:hypothetical protein
MERKPVSKGPSLSVEHRVIGQVTIRKLISRGHLPSVKAEGGTS